MISRHLKANMRLPISDL